MAARCTHGTIRWTGLVKEMEVEVRGVCEHTEERTHAGEHSVQLEVAPNAAED